MVTRVSYPVELKMKAIEMRLAEVPVSKWRIALLRVEQGILLGLTDIPCK
ncbi:hypothetical protein QF049_001491 [Paenibacillus sp. W4I10]|nr:hypothetical protein [Paenibacillus sp. W4I10]MDQ0720230.1 hypothetical protein [Paenibacillus sp. W4I10]